MSDHDHKHGHDHAHHRHNAPLSDVALRVKALESLLTEKGLVDPAALDAQRRQGGGEGVERSRLQGATHERRDRRHRRVRL